MSSESSQSTLCQSLVTASDISERHDYSLDNTRDNEKMQSENLSKEFQNTLNFDSARNHHEFNEEDDEEEGTFCLSLSIDISSRKSGQALKKLKCFDDEVYHKGNLKPTTNVYTTQDNSALPSHKHMIWVLTTLTADKDITNIWELATLNQAKQSVDWSKWKTAIKSELVSL